MFVNFSEINRTGNARYRGLPLVDRQFDQFGQASAANSMPRNGAAPMRRAPGHQHRAGAATTPSAPGLRRGLRMAGR